MIYTYRRIKANGHARIHQMPGHRVTFIGLLVAYLWLLSACGPMTIKDTATHTFVPIQGWVLELHRDVTIRPNRTRTFFQDGRIVEGVNEYEPHCQLRVWAISKQAQSVHADRFTIEKVFGSVDSVVSNGFIRLAAAGSTIVTHAGENSDGETQVIYFYFMGLHSDRQPSVTYLVCGGALDAPAKASYPTLQEVRASLGDYATLVMPGDS